MILEPTGISLRVEDVIVQMSPAWPVYAEHSFSTCRVPLLGKDAEDKPSVASCFGAVVSEQAVMTTEVMMQVAMRSRRRIIGVSPGWWRGVEASFSAEVCAGQARI